MTNGTRVTDLRPSRRLLRLYFRDIVLAVTAILDVRQHLKCNTLAASPSTTCSTQSAECRMKWVKFSSTIPSAHR
jgi:hypothetical protein